jgi:hypothetical protein
MSRGLFGEAQPLPRRELRSAAAARILGFGDGLVQPSSNRAEMDLKGNPRRAKAGSQVLVVAERLVLRLPTAAQGGTRQSLDGAVLMLDEDLACHQQRPVAHRRDGGRTIGIVLRPTIQPLVQERTAWASLNDGGHLVCAGHVRQDPGSPVQVEDLRMPAQALANVDAEVQVKADLDISPAIDLPHRSHLTSVAN